MKRAVLIAIVALLALPAVASADDFAVNTTLDTDDGACDPEPGGCSLRDALDVANNGDVITVPGGTYGLNDELFVAASVTIRGAGARSTTIRYTNTDLRKVMTVQSDVTLDMSRVRVTGGNNPNNPAGGIFVSFGATLNLSDSTVDGNTGDRGAGIEVEGTLNVARSAIVNNHAVGSESRAVGGGIEISSGAVATLTNVTVSKNTAVDSTSGDGQGGGIYATGNLDLLNVTIAENTAGPGNFGDGGGLFEDFGVPSSPLRTVAVNTLVARNAGGNCAGTVDHPVQSTNGVSDNSTQGNCVVEGANNQLVADARVGALANNGGPSDTNALLAGSPAVNKGAGCPATDQRGVAREGVCDVGAYEYHAPPPPPADQGLPDPVPHKNVNALPKSGIVKVKLPGTGKFVVLDEDTQIPLGTTVDVRRGAVTIVGAPGEGADFYAGIFKLSQTKGSKPITVLTLVEKLSCAKKKASAAAKKKRKRRLWGDGKGRFRTRGKRSAATVVGTKWLVQDTCTTTLTKVVRGRVKVRDFVKKKTVIVKAGKKYVARARR